MVDGEAGARKTLLLRRAQVKNASHSEAHDWPHRVESESKGEYVKLSVDAEVARKHVRAGARKCPASTPLSGVRHTAVRIEAQIHIIMRRTLTACYVLLAACLKQPIKTHVGWTLHFWLLVSASPQCICDLELYLGKFDSLQRLSIIPIAATSSSTITSNRG